MKYTTIANPKGVRRFADGSCWIPSGPVERIGAKPNPVVWEGWGKATKAVLLVGLKAGRNGPYYKKGDAIPESRIYGLTYGIRYAQVGEQYGASFLRQKGHYIPSQKRRVSERKIRENSVQVIVYPAPQESWKKFKTNIRELAEAYCDDLSQESVIVELIRNGIAEEVGKYKWVAKKQF